MEIWLGATSLGLCYGFLAMGVFITMRIYNFPDITADGSLTLGASVSSALLVMGFNPYLAVASSMLAGFIAGALTGTIHTKFKVNGLLSGILVTTGLYSINLHIMGRSNVPLIQVESVLTPFESLFSESRWVAALVYFSLVAIFVHFLLSLLFKTDFGLSMRATGDNETMIAAQGVNTNVMKIVGIGLSNAIIALSGSLVSQYQGFADISMGIGIIVFGLASVIIGESILSVMQKRPSISALMASAILGAIIFRILVAIALMIGLNPIDLKLITALFVLLAVALPQIKTGLK
ncbi:inner-membrane translocator [Chloroherpeton thalassium ATCC 35110]|uniref:Inner-membrane translocator n=1 Tax=Chloroherpeton thalassium (strain ATCC 35110 / GB-78) TaxID=517418 RepID=B3QVG8_CHLT3|nr:ABC transporter permease [Chloroherpeton thalassium]ACF14568.1 inner-membrane translocator [Chloroherpeton thalassium ATCC 35110]